MRKAFEIASWLAVAAPALCLSPSASSGQSRVSSPGWTIEGMLGASPTADVPQVLAGVAVTARLGRTAPIAPVAVVEVARFGSGYRDGVEHPRPDGTVFDAPSQLGGLGGRAGLRFSVPSGPRLSVTAGATKVEARTPLGAVLHADLDFPLGRRAGLLIAGRRVWYRDSAAGRPRTYTPWLLGLRLQSDQ